MIAALFLLVLLCFAVVVFKRKDYILTVVMVLMGLVPATVDIIGGKAGTIVGGIVILSVVILCGVRLFRYYKQINSETGIHDPRE